MNTPKLSIDLPPMDQVGYVVRDMEQALKRYEPLFGPFNVMEYDVSGALYRGTPRDCKLKIAYGRSGDIEIELIEVLEGQSPHREMIEQGLEGIQHIRFRVDDVDAVLQQIAADGFHPIWYHRVPVATWAYVEHESKDGFILEFLQMAA